MPVTVFKGLYGKPVSGKGGLACGVKNDWARVCFEGKIFTVLKKVVVFTATRIYLLLAHAHCLDARDQLKIFFYKFDLPQYFLIPVDPLRLVKS